MGHLHHAKPYPQWRRNELFDSEKVKTNGRTTHINDGINRPYFMKMDFLNRLVMHPAFGFGQTRKNLRRAILHAFRQTRTINNFENVSQMAVGVFMGSRDMSVGAADSGSIYCFKIE